MYSRRILFVSNLIKVLTVVVCVVNLFMPLYDNFVWKFSVFQLFAVFVWIYAGLTATGYFCKNQHIEKNGMILYEQNLSLPVILLGLNRIAESLYYFLFRRSRIDWPMYGILILLDVLVFIVLFVDKMNYGYAKEITTREEFVDADEE